MIYRPAVPEDGQKMLQLIESHASKGNMKLINTRRPDPYLSYRAESEQTEIVVCVDDKNRLAAQTVCLPRRVYLDGEIQKIGYITGLHKRNGSGANIQKLIDTGYARLDANQYICSFLDENKAVFKMFHKRGIVCPICDYTTYMFNPRAPRRVRHNLSFHRATQSDEKKLLEFYRTHGERFSYYPVFEKISDYPSLALTDFHLLEDNDGIIAAGALWNQNDFKQYIALDYGGVYSLASHISPVMRLMRYPPLPQKNTAANFAYISFFLCRNGNYDMADIFISEIAKAAREYEFMTIGTVNGSELDVIVQKIKHFSFGSTLCMINYDRSTPAPEIKNKAQLFFECALL